jgi:hypothetical protein
MMKCRLFFNFFRQNMEYSDIPNPFGTEGSPFKIFEPENYFPLLDVLFFKKNEEVIWPQHVLTYLLCGRKGPLSIFLT